MRSISTHLVYFTKYDNIGASSRLRSIQYFSLLRLNGFTIDHSFLISNNQLKRKYSGKSYNYFKIFISIINRIFKLILIDRNKIVIIEKELFPWCPYLFEKLFLHKLTYVLDYDDAIYHNYDSHSNSIIKFLLSTKHNYLLRQASLVLLGNTYLHRFATNFNENCFLFPTVVDLNHYPNINLIKTPTPKIVWIGSPSTSFYLESIKSVFSKLAEQYNFTLKVIGISSLEIKNVNIEFIPWSEDTEFMHISNSSVGIMPLLNNNWALGKCGYKIIQYMACSLPVIASRVGANTSIVDDHINGFLVNSHDEWFDKISLLLSDKTLCNTLGINGRIKVENKYSIQKSHITLISSLNKLNI